MEPLPQPGPVASPSTSAPSQLAAAIDQLWVRFLPEILERVGSLEAAAAASAANQLSTGQREAANAAAHKLAGTLGTFNLTRGTVLAREFELLFTREDSTDPALAGRLVSIAAQLRTIVESRK